MTARMKKDVMRFEQLREQFKFLRENGIETPAQMEQFRASLEEKLSVLTKQRTILNVQKKKHKKLFNLLYSAKRGIYEDTTKTGTVRFIKLPAETMELLRQYHRWYMELRFKNGDRWQDTGFLFVKENGEPMIPDGITAWLSDFSKRHDLPHINPHAFRHTMASILINSGKDVVSVSKRLGHAKVSTTTDIYSHIIMEADEQASECLADVMLRPTKKRAAI